MSCTSQRVSDFSQVQRGLHPKPTVRSGHKRKEGFLISINRIDVKIIVHVPTSSKHEAYIIKLHDRNDETENSLP
jgi:hypothetical protein